MCVGVTSSAEFGVVGAASTCRPLSCRTAYVRRSSGSRSAASSRTTSASVWRVKIEMRRDAPELQVEIDEDDPVRSALRWRSRCWSRSWSSRRRPSGCRPPPRGARGPRQPIGRDDRGEVLRALEPRSASTRASTSRASKGRAMTSSAPASRNPDAFLDLDARREDRDAATAWHGSRGRVPCRLGRVRLGGLASLTSFDSFGALPPLVLGGAAMTPTSMTASWCSSRATASSGSVVRVTV